MSGYVSNPSGPFAGIQGQTVPKPEKPPKKEKNPARQNRKKPIRVKQPSPEEIAKEKEILEYVRKRDCGICVVCGATGSEAHHIIPKRTGGRGALKELIDHPELRVLLCLECHHSGAHRGYINPYDFYIQAIEEGYAVRILLMRLLINEWAKFTPINVVAQIREDNKRIWKEIVGNVSVNAKTIGLFWKEVIKQIGKLK